MELLFSEINQNRWRTSGGIISLGPVEKEEEILRKLIGWRSCEDLIKEADAQQNYLLVSSGNNSWNPLENLKELGPLSKVISVMAASNSQGKLKVSPSFTTHSCPSITKRPLLNLPIQVQTIIGKFFTEKNEKFKVMKNISRPYFPCSLFFFYFLFIPRSFSHISIMQIARKSFVNKYFIHFSLRES